MEPPNPHTLAEILEIAFWASLTSNEGRPTRVRLAIVPAGALQNVRQFTHPLTYSEDELAKLAPAVWSTGFLAAVCAFTACMLDACTSNRVSGSPAAGNPASSTTPRPYNAPLREFQDPDSPGF